jgi:hypothetical protein
MGNLYREFHKYYFIPTTRPVVLEERVSQISGNQKQELPFWRTCVLSDQGEISYFL